MAKRHEKPAQTAFAAAFERRGLFVPPSAEQLTEVERLKYSSNQLRQELSEIAAAVDDLDLAAVSPEYHQVRDLFNKIQETLEKVNTEEISSLSETYKVALDEAVNDLIQLKQLKSDIITKLTDRVGLNKPKNKQYAPPPYLQIGYDSGSLQEQLNGQGKVEDNNADFVINQGVEGSTFDIMNNETFDMNMENQKLVAPMPGDSGVDVAVSVEDAEDAEEVAHKNALIQGARNLYSEMVDLCNVATPEEMLGANKAVGEAEKIFKLILEHEQAEVDKASLEQLEGLVLEFNDYKDQLMVHLGKDVDALGAEPEAAPAETEPVSEDEVDTSFKDRLTDYYHRWQAGDPTLLDKGWYNNLGAIEHDFGRFLKMAGYSDTESRQIYQTKLKPWVQKVVDRRKDIRKRKVKFNYSDLKEELIVAMKEALSGRDLDEAKLQELVAVQEEQGDPDAELESGSETSEGEVESPENLEELEARAEFLKGEFLNLKEQMLALGIPDQGIFDLVTENFTKLDSCHDDDKNRVFIDKSKYLKTLEGNIGAMREAVRVAGEATSEEAPVSAPEVAPVSTETSGEEKVNETKESAGLSYQEKRETWRKSNEAFKTAEREYNQSLKDYYENRGVLSKGWAGARSLFGMSPKFPREVAVLQAKYQTARNFYAREFNELLALRTKFNESNADRSLKTDKYKAQFARKFILKPTEKLLELQEKTAMSEAESSKMRKVMKIMSKNKWGIRVGTVVLAGTIGALSGGASLAVMAAGSRAARIGAGVLGGAIAGAGINRAMKGYVDEAGKRLVSAKESASTNFTLDNLNQLESEMLSAKADEDSRKSQRMAATIFASGVAGFGAGYGTGALANEVVPPGAGGNNIGGGRGLNPVNPGASGTPEAPASAASAAEKVASAAEASEGAPIFQIGKVSVPAYNPDGTLASEQVISGFELKSSNANFTGSGLSDVEVAKVTSSMKLAAQDVLAERPHIPQEELEKIVFEKLKSEYGNTSWWQEAKISSVSISDIDFVDTVESGDNLSTILHKQLIAEYKAGNLNLPKEMSDSQLADYMYKKFPELVNQATDKPGLSMEEWQKLGIRSEDLNKISVGQKINLGDVIDVINDKPKLATTGIDTGLTAEDLPARPKTGALPIKDSDGFEKLIKIKSDLPWKDISPQELEEARIQGILDGTIDTPPPKGLQYPSIEPGPGDNSMYTVPKSSLAENVPTRGAYELPQMPKLMHPVAGQYFTSPEFINYLKTNGLSMEVMEKVITKTVDDFEAQTYTRGEIFYNTYDSPYDHLSGLTMAKVVEMQAQAGGSEKVLIQLLREQAPDANFKAETLRAWSQWVGATIETNKVPFGENTTLADVFSRSVSQNIVEHTYKNNLSGVVQQSSGGNSYFDILKRRLAEGVDRGPLEKRMDSYSFRKR